MANQLNWDSDSDSDCGCRNELNLDRLCVKKFKAKCLCACRVDAKNSCVAERLDAKDAYFNGVDADSLCAKQVTAADLSAAHICVDALDVSSSLCVKELGAPTVCSNDVKTNLLDAGSICAGSISSPVASFQSLMANDVCVPGALRSADFRQCGKYRATASYGANVTYTLGDWLQFNTINDDPNGNIAQVPHTSYVAPLSGYYVLTLKVNQSNLVASVPVLGGPISNLEIYLNGVLARESFNAYINFFNKQKNLLTTLISLNAGDLVAFKYKILALDNLSGQYEVVGTITVEGNGTEYNGTMFKASLLTVDCVDLPCAPSLPCVRSQCVPCVPQQTSCRSCTPEAQKDCKACWSPSPAAPVSDENGCDSCQ